MAEHVMDSVQPGRTGRTAAIPSKPARQGAIRLVRQAVDSGVCRFEPAHDNNESGGSGDASPKGRGGFTVAMLDPSLRDLPADTSPREIMAAVDRSISHSCSTLRRTSLECLLLPGCAEMAAFNGWLWRRLLEHIQNGTVQRLGVAVETPAEARQALASYHVRHLQLPFNLLDWRWRDAGIVNQIGRRRDLTVHARSVFLEGLLANEDETIWPAIEGVDPPAVLALLRTVAGDMGRESVADLSLAYARGRDFIDGVLIDTETPEQIDLNLRLSLKTPLTLPQCWEVEARVPRLPVALLNRALWP